MSVPSGSDAGTPAARPLVLELEWLSPSDVERFENLLKVLARTRRPRVSFGQGHLLIGADGIVERLGIGYPLLPPGTELLRRSRRGIPALAASIVRAVTSPDVLRVREHDSGAHRADWYGAWDVLRHLAVAMDPDFMSRNPAAHAGSPWLSPRCYAFKGEIPLLTQEAVDHAFSGTPYLLEITCWDFGGGDGNTFMTRHDVGLGFDDDPQDPVAVMRTWAQAPESLRRAA